MSRRSFLRAAAAASTAALSMVPQSLEGAPERLAGVSHGQVTVEKPEEPPLYLLTYDHGGGILWGTQKFAENLRTAVAWLERYPSFKIGLDNEAYTYDFLAEREPALLNELRGYLERYRGRLGVGTATYGQPLSCFINEESNVRQLQYAREATRRLLGAAPPIYAMSEHAMHSQMPQLLRGFAFAGALMRTHFQMYGYNPTFDEPIGWWIGLDGSRIPAVPTYRGEGAQFGKTTEDNWILTRYPGPECKESLEEFRKKFVRVHPLVASRVDDAPLRKEELVKECEGRPGYRWMLLEELLGALPAPQAELHATPNEFVVRMPWGYCGNEIWNGCREAEVAVLTAERLAALALMLGGEGRDDQLAHAWKNLLVAQHHDIQITGLVADARQFLGTSMEASAEVAQASLRHTAAQMSGGKTAQVTVFNPHSWRRKEWVEVEVPLPPGTGVSLGRSETDNPCPATPSLHPRRLREARYRPRRQPGSRPAVGKPGEAGDPGRRARAGRLVRDHGAAIGFSDRVGDRRGTPDDSHPRLELAARSAGRHCGVAKPAHPRGCAPAGTSRRLFRRPHREPRLRIAGALELPAISERRPLGDRAGEGRDRRDSLRFRSHRLSRFSTRRLPRSLPD